MKHLPVVVVVAVVASCLLPTTSGAAERRAQYLFELPVGSDSSSDRYNGTVVGARRGHLPTLTHTRRQRNRIPLVSGSYRIGAIVPPPLRDDFTT
uniref:Putative secreted protein n=1 Tax=Anopheles marajoara TaxID=58244 RepID=A0A2M4C9E0_9DIPT